MSGPCLSSSVPGRPLRPGTRRSLGEPLPHQQADRPRAHPEAAAFATFDVPMMPWKITRGINPSFPGLSPSSGQVAHVILTRAPLNRPNIATQSVPFDLHVLSTPPAFVLSQNQTLRIKVGSTAKTIKILVWKIDGLQIQSQLRLSLRILRIHYDAQRTI